MSTFTCNYDYLFQTGYFLAIVVLEIMLTEFEFGSLMTLTYKTNLEKNFKIYSKLKQGVSNEIAGFGK